MRYLLYFFVLCFACITAAQGKEYPSRPITVVVPFAAGGFTDRLGRAVARQISEKLGQSVIVENRVGGGGNIAAAYAAHAKPDGYTLLVGNNPLVINPNLESNVKYDPLKDFVPIIALGTTPNVLVISNSVPAKTLGEFVALAKAHPGKYSYATSAIGSTSHLGMELFKSVAGVDLVTIPYKGSAEMITDLLAGRVEASVDNLLFQVPYINDGRVRALALMADARSDLVPTLPTISELGYPGAESSPWYMVLAPTGTPDEIVQKLNAAISKGLAEPEYLNSIKGMQVKGSSPQQARDLLVSESAKWGKIVKALHLKK